MKHSQDHFFLFSFPLLKGKKGISSKKRGEDLFSGIALPDFTWVCR